MNSKTPTLREVVRQDSCVSQAGGRLCSMVVGCTEMQAHLCGSPGKGRQKNLLSQPEYGVLGVLLSLGWLSPAATCPALLVTRDHSFIPKPFCYYDCRLTPDLPHRQESLFPHWLSPGTSTRASERRQGREANLPSMQGSQAGNQMVSETLPTLPRVVLPRVPCPV